MISGFSKIFIIMFVMTVIAAATVFIFNNAQNEPNYCVQEAMLCSDGSYVSRVGPNCEFTACPKEDLIRVDTPRANEIISSPLIVRGMARGVWFFEGSFPIKLLDENGNILAQIPAQAQGEWMTNDFVPFEAKINFSVPVVQNGVLVLEKDDPSGLPEHADELRMPILFSGQQL